MQIGVEMSWKRTNERTKRIPAPPRFSGGRASEMLMVLPYLAGGCTVLACSLGKNPAATNSLRKRVRDVYEIIRATITTSDRNTVVPLSA